MAVGRPFESPVIKIDDTLLRVLLKQLKHVAGDVSPALNTIGRKLLSDFTLTFSSKQTPSGVAWPDYKSTYIYRGRGKSRRRVPATRNLLLLDTGKLRKSLSVRRHHNVFKISKLSMKVGTKVPYAYVHHFGTAKVPRRRFIEYVPRKHDNMMINVMIKYIKAATSRTP